MSRLSKRALLTGAASLVASRALPAKQQCGFVPDAVPQPVCGPTVNLVNFVQFNGVVNGLTCPNCRFTPTTDFPYFLFSGWACCPYIDSGGSNWAFAPINVCEIDARSFAHGTNSQVGVKVYRNNASFGNVNFDGIYLIPPNMQWHILVSVNCLTQVVQVYVNDMLMTPGNGPTWIAHENMAHQTVDGSGNISVVDVGNFVMPLGPAAASLWWFPSTTTWVDLSATVNRRKFINADLTPVDLGVHGENPLGTAPPIYLIAKTSANDLITNYGLGGVAYPGYSTSWSINLGQPPGTVAPPLTLQAAGTCPCPQSVAQVMLWVRGAASSGNPAGPYFASTKDSGGSWVKTQRTDALSGDAWGSVFVPVNEDNPLAQVLVVNSYVNPSYGAVWSTAGYSFGHVCGPVLNASGWCLTSVSGFPTATVKTWWNNASIVTHHPNVALAAWQSYVGAVFGGKIVLAGLNCGATGSFGLNYETGASGDGGTTWTMGGNDSAIGLTSGLFYANQWFSGGTTGRTKFAAPQGGAYVYALEANGGFVCKSSDGLHWTSLKTADLPQFLWTPTGDHIVQCAGDVKCDKTGQIIAFYGKMYGSDGTSATECSFWLSTNGGVSWSEKANRTTLGITNGVANSFGMTPDGSKFVICASNSGGSGTFLFRSVDGGNSWAAMSPPNVANNPWQCGISPDGNNVVMMYDANGPGWTSANKTTMIDVTANQGLSWVTSDAPWDHASLWAEMWVFNTGS